MGTRDRIVTATNELFRTKGYNGTSLADVSSAAAAPTGSLYHFFPGGKSALAASVLRESGVAYQELFELIAEESEGPAQAVSAFFDGAADTLEENDFIEICPIGSVAREMASTDEGIRVATADVFEAWTGALGTRFAVAGLDANDATELASTVIAALEGAFVLARAQRKASCVRSTGRQMRRLVELHLDDVSP